MSDSTLPYGPVLVLGAGELGMPVLVELARLRDAGQAPPVSVLLRPAKGGRRPADQAAAMRALDVDIVEADLAAASVAELAAVFAPFGEVICCTGFVGGTGTQRKITAAVIEARVRHYVPWQFGVDYDVVGRGSGQNVWDEQLDVREMLRSQSAVKWTILSTGMFTSFVFLPEFGLVDLERNRVHALGDWSNRLTVTTPEDIGRLTALAVAARPALDDQVVFVAGDTFTYAELADTVDRVLGRTVDRVLRTMPELKADAAANPDDAMAKYRLSFARPTGVAWPIEETFNARRGLAMVDVATWLRRWRDGGGTSTPDWTVDPVPDELAVRIARAEESVRSAEGDAVAAVAERYYGSWNAASETLFSETVSPAYVDHTLPAGRKQGPSGLAAAQRDFRAAFPNGRVHVLQQIVAGDRVASHLRVTGRFLGERGGVRGKGQRIDYLATDVMRVAEGKITDNWHVEDHVSLHRQLD